MSIFYHILVKTSRFFQKITNRKYYNVKWNKLVKINKERKKNGEGGGGLSKAVDGSVRVAEGRGGDFALFLRETT